MVLPTAIGNAEVTDCPDVHITLKKDITRLGRLLAGVTITNTSQQKIEYYNRDPVCDYALTVLAASTGSLRFG